MSLKLNDLSSSSKTEKQQNILIVLTIALVTFLCFANTLSGQFIFDDQILIIENPNIKSLSNIPNLFLQGYWIEKSNTSGLSNALYRPLTHVSFALNFAINGLSPYGYHLVNIVIHIINSLLIYWICEHYTKIKQLSLLTALFFSIHPVHSEAVAAIYGRPELLATMFLLIAWWFYIKSTDGNLWYVLSLITYFLSLFCKESGIVFVGILLLVHICQQSSWATRLKPSPKLLGYIFVTIPYLIIRVSVTKILGFPKVGQMLGNESFTTRVFTMSYGYAEYFLMLVWPAKLYTEYDFTIIPKITSFSLPVLIYLTLIFGAIAIAFWQLNRRPIITFAILFFFVTTSIVSNIFIPTGVLIAERVIYLSVVTSCLLLAALLYYIYQLGLKKSSIALFTVILILTTARTYYRNIDFQNNINLFSSIAKLSLNHSKAFTALGTEYEKLGDIAKAESFYDKALEVSYNKSLAHVNLARIKRKQGKEQEAIELLKKALELDPNNADANDLWGAKLLTQGDLCQAKIYLTKAISLDPAIAEAHNNLGVLYAQMNLYNKAREQFLLAVKLNPNAEKYAQNLELINEKGQAPAPAINCPD